MFLNPAHRNFQSLSLWVRVIFVFFFYALGVYISLFFSFLPSQIAVFWIPNGILLAILLRSPYRDWLAYLSASMLAYVVMVIAFNSYQLMPALAMGFINCFESFLGAWLFLCFNSKPIVLSDVKTVLRLILLAGVAGMVISASLGAATIVLVFGHDNFWLVWSTWFAGDGIGFLLFTPCILAWTSGETKTYKGMEFLEFGLHFLSCIVASILIYSDYFHTEYALSYFMFPLLLWAGLRFDLRITTLSLIVFCVVSACYTDAGLGPFAISYQSLSLSVFRFQLFFGITISTVLVVSAIISERKRIEREKETLIHSLEDAIVQIKTLSGLLPICAHCKKIRDNDGSWKPVESYIQSHSDAQFSHGICPECTKELYPDYYAKLR